MSYNMDTSDDLYYPMYEGILEQQVTNNDRPNMKEESLSLGGTNKDEDCYQKKIDHISADVEVQQRHMETKPRVVPKSDMLGKMKEISSTYSNHNKWREITIGNKDMVMDGGSSSLVAKKMDHNAKEKQRRMKINASYEALRVLLPDSSSRLQRKWSAPSVVDSVLKYIPQLENEIEDLESKKQQLVQSVSSKETESSINTVNTRTSKFSRTRSIAPTVSITRVTEDEAIVHIFMDAKAQGSVFANLLQKLENEGICVNSASSLSVRDNISSSHLHIQMNGVSNGAECIRELQDKFISWLR